MIHEALAVTMFLAGVFAADLREKLRPGVYRLATWCEVSAAAAEGYPETSAMMLV